MVPQLEHTHADLYRPTGVLDLNSPTHHTIMHFFSSLSRVCSDIILNIRRMQHFQGSACSRSGHWSRHGCRLFLSLVPHDKEVCSVLISVVLNRPVSHRALGDPQKLQGNASQERDSARVRWPPRPTGCQHSATLGN